MKFGRNDSCWCGSGKKYKACHADFDAKLTDYKRRGVIVPKHKLLKTPAQLEGIRKAGKLNTEILDMVGENIRAGMSTEEINTLVHEYTVSHGGIPAPLNYNGFPKSVCTSVNDVICHGIPAADEVLKEGDIGAVISEYIYAHGYTVLHDIGGHGVGNEFHEDPYVCHIGKRGTGMLLVPGMVFTIEPMVNAGEEDFFQDADNGWTIYTEDGSLSAQWEYTVAVTEDGAEVLTH